MTTAQKLSTIVAVRYARTSDPGATDPTITFEVDVQSGETFEVPFTAKSMAAATMMALPWKPLHSELKKIPEPKPDEREQVRCSFCGKECPESVRGIPQKVVAGPDVFICRECVSLTIDIMAADASWREAEIEALTRWRETDRPRS